MVRSKLSEVSGRVLQNDFWLYARRLEQLTSELYAVVCLDLEHPQALEPMLDEINGVAGRMKAMCREFARRLVFHVEAELRAEGEAAPGPV